MLSIATEWLMRNYFQRQLSNHNIFLKTKAFVEKHFLVFLFDLSLRTRVMMLGFFSRIPKTLFLIFCNSDKGQKVKFIFFKAKTFSYNGGNVLYSHVMPLFFVIYLFIMWKWKFRVTFSDFILILNCVL